MGVLSNPSHTDSMGIRRERGYPRSPLLLAFEDMGISLLHGRAVKIVCTSILDYPLLIGTEQLWKNAEHDITPTC